MSIDLKKSSFMRIGPRFNAPCIVVSLPAMVGKYCEEIRQGTKGCTLLLGI